MGGVAAEDPDGRTVAYDITAGNEGGEFEMDSSSGEITVAGELDYVSVASYSLTVQATDGDGEANEVTVWVEVAGTKENTEETTQDIPPQENDQSTDAVAPPAPQNLSATLNDDGSITLSWDTSGDDSVTGYQVLRRRPSLGEDTLQVYVEDTGSTGTSYTDTAVTAGERHVYRVKAINSAGVGGRSNFARVDP